MLCTFTTVVLKLHFMHAYYKFPSVKCTSVLLLYHSSFEALHNEFSFGFASKKRLRRPRLPEGVLVFGAPPPPSGYL